MKDEPDGRKEVGSSQVSIRTRAFAAFGLGLIGYVAGDNTVRQDIAEHLIDVLESPHFSRRDVKVGAMTGLGLTAIDVLPADAAVENVEGDTSNRKHVLSRQSQVDYIINYFDPEQARANKETRHWFVRAHAPTAIARLMDGAPEGTKDAVVAKLLDGISKHSKEEEGDPRQLRAGPRPDR